MSPDLMRRFLAELKTGTISSNDTTDAVAAAFEDELSRLGRGRGRPRKTSRISPLFKIPINAKGVARSEKRTAEDLLNVLAQNVARGLNWREACGETASALGLKSWESIRARLKPFGGKAWFVANYLPLFQKFGTRAPQRAAGFFRVNEMNDDEFARFCMRKQAAHTVTTGGKK